MDTLGLIKEIIVTLFFVWYYFIEAAFYFIFPTWKYKKDIRGETVLVTGAGSGIGRLLAIRFAQQGAKVICWDVQEKANNETIAQLKNYISSPDKVHGYQVDVCNKEEVYEAAALVKQEVGAVTMLVNNAGVTGSCKLVTDYNDETVNRVIGINALALFWTVKAFLPDMLKRNHGHLVTIASIAGFSPSPKAADYCASKAAAIAFHQCVRMEIAALEADIATTVISPYHMKTRLFEGFKLRFAPPSMDPEYAADQMMDAILRNQETLIIPRILYLIMPIAQWLLPSKAAIELGKLMGMFECVDEVKPKLWPEKEE